MRYVNHVTYGLGGYDPDAPNGNVVEAWEIEIETVEGTDSSGNPVEVDVAEVKAVELKVDDAGDLEIKADGRAVHAKNPVEVDLKETTLAEATR